MRTLHDYAPLKGTRFASAGGALGTVSCLCSCSML